MSEQQDPPQPSAPADERDRRIQALHNLAQSGASSSPAPASALERPSPTTARRARTKLLGAVISALVLVGIAGGLIAHHLSPAKSSSSQHTPAPVTFSPESDNLTCPRDVAWSPDGTTVAILGYERNCANDFPDRYSYHPGSIKLYDAATGHQTITLRPDPIIAAALHLTPPAIATPDPYAWPYDRDTSQQAITYTHLLWSPDGKQLAVTFSVLIATAVTANGSFETKDVQGVLLSDLSGAQTRVLAHVLAHGELYSGLWNLVGGSYIPIAGQHASSSATHANVGWRASPALLPPAVRYQWTDTGQLQAVTPLSATSTPAPQPSAPVGLPDGGKGFTVWQPGVAQRFLAADFATNPPQPVVEPMEIWQSSFAAWSADGKYLFAGSGGDEVENWRLPLSWLPKADSATLSKIGLADAPILPIRDAGLAAALHRYQDTTINPEAQDTLVTLAWSPDGKRLAVEAQLPHSASNPPRISDFAVSIYDCASGKLLGTLRPKLGSDISNNRNAFLRWSPDSTHLLLYAPALSGAQIWGPKDLPR